MAIPTTALIWFGRSDIKSHIKLLSVIFQGEWFLVMSHCIDHYFQKTATGRLICIVVLCLCSAPAVAVTLLCGYEPGEPIVSLSTPDPTASATIVTGGGTIPYPVDGDYMLRLSWTNETDRKVEVKHQWPGFTFSLAPYDRILADVYIPSSIMPGLIGVWDAVFDWHPAVAPINGDGWYTVEFDVSANGESGLDEISALLFENLPVDSGTIYIDNLRLESLTPDIVTVTGQEEAIEIVWNPIHVSGLQGYNIYRAVAGTNNYIKLNGGAYPGFVYVDFVGGNGLSYTYKVTSIVNGTESPYSDMLGATSVAQTDDEFLTTYQKAAFRFYWDYGHPVSGLSRDTFGYYASSDTCAVGGSGMGLLSIIVGSERGFVTRQQAARRTLKILRFLNQADRFKGAWPHMANGATGRTIAIISPYDDGADLVETAYVAQGLITVRQYYLQSNPVEDEIRTLADQLWQQIEWDWFRRLEDTSGDYLYWHWSENYGWQMDHLVAGFNEAMMTYILATASPTYGVPTSCYHNGWAGWGYLNGSTYYGYRIWVGGLEIPLFLTHYQFHALDPRGKRDNYCNYYDNAKNIVRAHREYCIANPGGYAGYGANEWGLSADPDPWGYDAHCPISVDNGTISTHGAIASMPFTPDESIDFMRALYAKYTTAIYGVFGFIDSFNAGQNWFSGGFTSINVGSNINMIENSRTQLLWNLFMTAPEINPTLKKLGWGLYPDSGLNCSYYEGSWSSMPSYSSMTPLFEDTVGSFHPMIRNRTDYYGLRFTGYIDIETEGRYLFYLNSDDGSKLYIDNVLAVNNDGVHPEREIAGDRYLTAGLHPIKVDYFEQTGSECLEVSYSGPTITKQIIPASVLRTEIHCGDLNRDGLIDIADLQELANGWMTTYSLPDFACISGGWDRN